MFSCLTLTRYRLLFLETAPNEQILDQKCAAMELGNAVLLTKSSLSYFFPLTALQLRWLLQSKSVSYVPLIFSFHSAVENNEAMLEAEELAHSEILKRTPWGFWDLF